jgi:hypothetical protein
MELTRKKKELLCGYCRKSCSTPWNLKIHVQRKHAEKAQPARPGSASFCTTTQVHSTKNIVEHSNYQDTSLSYHPEAYRRQNVQLFPEVASKKQDSRDPFHKIMQDIREFKEILLHRNEIKDLMGRASVSSQPYENNDWVMWSLLVSLSIVPQNNTRRTRDNKLPTGYRTSLCNICLSGGGLEPVYNPIEGEALMKFSHTCDPRSLALVQNITDIPNRKSQIQHDLVNYLSKVVNIRIGQRETYLKVVDLPAQIFTTEERKKVKLPANRSLIEEEDCINLNYREDRNHWLYQAINDDGTMKMIKVDKSESIKFLNIAKATFGAFRARTVDGAKHYFLMYIVF